MPRRSLPDLNVLIALTDPDHKLNTRAREWFVSRQGTWGLCPLTESGYIRVTINPVMSKGERSLEQSIAILQALKGRGDHLYWEIDSSWVDLTAPFASRIQGHQQVTDAYLLGLAIRGEGEVVTFDRGLSYLAGTEFRKNVRLLE